MTPRPDCIRHVSELPDNGGTVWPGSDEVLSIRTPLSRPLGLARIGVHHEVLPPGRRTSLPHAELWEEECVYVLAGRPQAWIDSTLHDLAPDDIVVFPPGTGIRHTIVNHSPADVRLLVIGERLDPGFQCLEKLAAVWSGHDLSALDALFTEDAVYEDVAAGTVYTGVEQISRFFTTTFAASPQVMRDFAGVFVSGDRVACEWVHRVGNAGSSARGASITRLRRGRISAHTDYSAP